MRIPNDFYPTETKLTEVLLDYIDLRKNDTVFECCAGNGAIAKILEKEKCDVITNDKVSERKCDYNLDLRDPESWDCLSGDYPDGVDWVVTNPPYNCAHEIIPHAMKFATKGIAMLMRLTYLEPCNNRAEFLQSYQMTHLILFSPRPSFRSDMGNKTDSVTSAWMVWEHLPAKGSTQISFVTNWK